MDNRIFKINNLKNSNILGDNSAVQIIVHDMRTGVREKLVSSGSHNNINKKKDKTHQILHNPRSVSRHFLYV